MKELVPGSFVFEIPNALPAELCKQIIAQFEADPRKVDGVVGIEKQMLKHVKDTTDLLISGLKEWAEIDRQIFDNLQQGLKLVMPFLEQGVVRLKIDTDSGYNIQKYKTGKGYIWHTDHRFTKERCRQLVFIYYLNTVESGGETEFLHQNISVRPTEGTLVLFPPFWTHIHRSAPVLSGTKYIITGWLEADVMG